MPSVLVKLFPLYSSLFSIFVFFIGKVLDFVRFFSNWNDFVDHFKLFQSPLWASLFSAFYFYFTFDKHLIFFATKIISNNPWCYNVFVLSKVCFS